MSVDKIDAIETIDTVPSCGQENDYRRASAGKPPVLMKISEFMQEVEYKRTLLGRPKSSYRTARRIAAKVEYRKAKRGKKG